MRISRIGLSLLLGLTVCLSVRAQDGTCSVYCDLTPDSSRDLCPETIETRPANRVNTTANLRALRNTMGNTTLTGQNGPVSAYLVYEGSYYGGGVTDHDRRMQWISGFSGSSGYIVVTRGDGTIPDRAALWTDGRYFLQGDQELDCNWILMKEGQPGTPSETDWLIDILPDGALVGAHPDYMDTTTWQTYEEAFNANGKGIQLVQVPQDLFDYVWTEENGRPPISNEDIYIHDIAYAGVSWQDKLTEIRQSVTGTASVYIVSLLDDIAWLFNLRGADRINSPLFDSVAMIFDNDETRLYLRDKEKHLANEALRTHLNTGTDGSCGGQTGTCVEVLEFDDAIDDINDFQNDAQINSVWINTGGSYSFYLAAGDKRMEDDSPIQLPKSQKNPTERQRYRECQIRDSAYLVEFMAELEQGIANGDSWSEMSAADRLYEIRSQDAAFRMLSFETIAAFGSNGAVIHYRPIESTNKAITTNGMFLLDSGGNYLDGTTDVTRTFHFGTPSDRQKQAYTRVLMGVIDLATTVWPFGWRGSDIDARTRTPIWQNGWDFNHGTGHGIGYFLNVHEGPGRINIGYESTTKPLHEHQYYSDEPGYYEPDAFGVRLETIVEIVNASVPNYFDNKNYLTFDPVTFVPFEPKLINYDLLDTSHRRWLNDYHAKCEETTGQYLFDTAQNQAAYDWLMARTARIPEDPNYNTSGSAGSVPNHGLLAVVAILLAVFLGASS